jgi:hypothetical protein
MMATHGAITPLTLCTLIVVEASFVTFLWLAVIRVSKGENDAIDESVRERLPRESASAMLPGDNGGPRA